MLPRSSLATAVVALTWVALLALAVAPGVTSAQGWSEEGVIEAPASDDPAPWIDPECDCPRGVRADPNHDGACPALDPELVRARYREELGRLFGTEPLPADADLADVARTLRRSPLASREGAVRDLSSDVAIRDTEAAAAAVAVVAERWGLPEEAVRQAAAAARERLLARLEDDGLLDAEAGRCHLQRIRLHFRAPDEGDDGG